MSRIESWEVWQLPGGCLLYLHSRFGRLPDAEAAHGPRATDAPTMPFGKYRGAPLDDVVLDDVSYAGWLLDQPWFGQRFPKHHRHLKTMLHRGGIEGPSAA